MVLLIYRIVGNFRKVQIFAIFVTHSRNAKIKTAKILTAVVLVKIFHTCVLCTSLAA